MIARLIACSRREGRTGAEPGDLRALLGEMGASPASCGRVLPAGAAAEALAVNPWDVPALGR